MTDEYQKRNEHEALVMSVNNEIHLFHATGDARFFWRAYRRLHQAGEPIPQSYLDVLADFAGRILMTENVAELPAALGLAGSEKAHIGPKQSAAYRRRWHLASEVLMVRDLYKMSLADAIKTVARNRGLSAATVKKAHYEIFTKPATGAKRRESVDAGMALQNLWR